MRKSTTAIGVHTVSSAAVLQASIEEAASKHCLYVGLDVHKDTIAVAVAYPGRGEPQYFGEIANTPKALGKLVARLSEQVGGEAMLWCYEAGPCGYVIHRQLLSAGQHCEVVAPPRGASSSRRTVAMR